MERIEMINIEAANRLVVRPIQTVYRYCCPRTEEEEKQFEVWANKIIPKLRARLTTEALMREIREINWGKYA